MLTVRALYRQGQIEFLEKLPGDIHDANVLVTFLESSRNGGKKMIRRGMFPELKKLTEEHFKEAEWRLVKS